MSPEHVVGPFLIFLGMLLWQHGSVFMGLMLWTASVIIAWLLHREDNGA